MGKINNPNQIVLVTSRYKDKDNVLAMTWHTKASFQPNLYIICVDKSRFSYHLIKKGKCFCINYMPYSLKNKIIYCGTNSGKNIDKFKEAKLEKEECEKINCPRLKNSLAFVECRVVKSIEAGDHIVFIGHVENAKFKKEGKRPFQLEGTKFTKI